jgi:cleavage and polyadenylation specificity factor subunit 3
MNANIRSRFARRDNPFDFKYVKWLKDAKKLDAMRGPCVVLASAQFVSYGLSRHLLEEWAADPKNGVIITGYSIEGTMARVSAITYSFVDLYRHYSENPNSSNR